MCGIAGIFSRSGNPIESKRLQRMSESLLHRGPDGSGEFMVGPVGLVHRRLAIVDLSELSAQPMVDRKSGSALSFNGEIYNFRELREELEKLGEIFVSGGDAEVLLKGLTRYGPSFVERADGDFAVAFWDSPRRKLFLIRDRFGVKPLYYATTPSGELAFASEIRALFEAGVAKELNRGPVMQYLRYRYVMGEETLFRGVRSVRAGEWLEIAADGLSKVQYWRLTPKVPSCYDEGVSKLGDSLAKSIALRTRADVSVGLLLSGGIDSGTIALGMRSELSDAFPAVTYAVPGKLSEARQSGRLAERIGLAHRVIDHPRGYLDRLSATIRALEEPIGDSTILPAFQLFEECRLNMKVVLSGEGADEIFGGYAHQHLLKKWIWLRQRGFGGLFSTGAHLLPWLPSRLLGSVFPYPAQFNTVARDRAAQLLRARSLAQAQELASTVMTESEAGQLLEGAAGRSGSVQERQAGGYREVIFKDLENWLPNYGLLRVDKLSMRHGLECRVPFLNHEVVERAVGLTLARADRFFAQAKKPLSDWVGNAYPAHAATITRKKQPFFLPEQTYLDPEFQGLCNRELSDANLSQWGLFSKKGVRSLLERPMDFVTGKQIVCVLHLQTWLKEFF